MSLTSEQVADYRHAATNYLFIGHPDRPISNDADRFAGQVLELCSEIEAHNASGGALKALRSLKDSVMVAATTAYSSTVESIPLERFGPAQRQWLAMRAAITAAVDAATHVWRLEKPALHPATEALFDLFASVVRQKLAFTQQRYGYTVEWQCGDWMDECRAQLLEHVQKGDPRDVAAYCAFLWYHGERTVSNASNAAPVVSRERDEQERMFDLDSGNGRYTPRAGEDYSHIVPGARTITDAPTQEGTVSKQRVWAAQAHITQSMVDAAYEVYLDAMHTFREAELSVSDVSRIRRTVRNMLVRALTANYAPTCGKCAGAVGGNVDNDPCVCHAPTQEDS